MGASTCKEFCCEQLETVAVEGKDSASRLISVDVSPIGYADLKDPDVNSNLSEGVESERSDPDTDTAESRGGSSRRVSASTSGSSFSKQGLARFVEGLALHGVDTSAWPKDLPERLYSEVHRQRRCVITKPCPALGRAKRVLRIVRVRVLAEIFGVEHVLMSRLQISSRGGIVHRKQFPLRRLMWTTPPDTDFEFGDPSFLQESCSYTEDLVHATKKVLKDRLGLAYDWQQQNLEEDKQAYSFRVEDKVESLSYPGLLSCYAIHEAVFRVSDPSSSGVLCLGLPSGQEFATTDGNAEVCFDGGQTVEYEGSQLNLWTWERTATDCGKCEGPARSRKPIKRVPIPTLSGQVLQTIRNRIRHRSKISQVPCRTLRIALEGQDTDWVRVRMIANQIRNPNYSLNDFGSDLSVFPELSLYLLDGDVVPGPRGKAMSQVASSGRTIGDEYQRTVGAFFAIYWLMRLNVDGKEGFSFGVDDDYTPVKPDAEEDLLHPAEKRLAFYRESLWGEFENLLIDADLLQVTKGGNMEVNPKRLMTLLALTSFHDIMKVEALLPEVQTHDSPYHGYVAGDVIGDHDHALSYIMDCYPEMLPSFTGLSEAERASVKFTQCELCFNFGWLVQAEAPPGAIFTRMRQALAASESSSHKCDLALYFVHWLTDLAGAEPTPLGGCEKFVIKFPLHVLNGFLSSFKVVTQIADRRETEVFEDYLKMRWLDSTPSLGPVPEGPDAVLKMRLLCMSQTNSRPLLEAVSLISSEEKELLSVEMSLTGCEGQSFSRNLVPKSLANSPRGPAFLVYYGPAYMQSLGSDSPIFRLSVLAEVYRKSRELWPFSPSQAGKTVTVRIDAIKACSDWDLLSVMKTGHFWAVIKKNDSEAMVERLSEKDLDGLDPKKFRTLLLVYDVTKESSVKRSSLLR